jgi:hypothetical protein
MAAPTNAADVKKTLANQEPSTHGPILPTVGTVATAAMEGTPALPGHGSAGVFKTYSNLRQLFLL